jgi:hypothetical protein
MLAPHLASSTAIARPMPPEAPVTTATWPARGREAASWEEWLTGNGRNAEALTLF